MTIPRRALVWFERAGLHGKAEVAGELLEGGPGPLRCPGLWLDALVRWARVTATVPTPLRARSFAGLLFQDRRYSLDTNLRMVPSILDGRERQTLTWPGHSGQRSQDADVGEFLPAQERSRFMPTYVALANFTDQGIKNFRDTVRRAARRRRESPQSGGRCRGSS